MQTRGREYQRKCLGGAKDGAEAVRHLKEAARGGHESSRKRLDEQGVKW